MRILAVDIGGLTQDILIFDTSQTLENCVKMIMPSPSIRLAQKIRRATETKRSVYLNGVNMGGGPSKKALMNHLKSGLPVFATCGAAATFNDDLQEVAAWGVNIISEENDFPGIETERIETKDLDLAAIKKALCAFEVESCFDAIAVAVLDHGASPPGVSDRRFRFQCLRQGVEKRKDLLAFAYLAPKIPPFLTRMTIPWKCCNRSLSPSVVLMLTLTVSPADA